MFFPFNSQYSAKNAVHFAVQCGKRRLFVRTVTACLCFVLILACFAPVVASASTPQWVRVVKDDVLLYTTAYSSKVTMELQKSYYLQVLQEENGMYLVSVMHNQVGFPTITGYVFQNDVERCDQTPVLPYYPTASITVLANSAVIKLSPMDSAQTLVVATNTQQLSFYGQTESYGKTWFYVYYAGMFGYVESSLVTQPVIALHPTPIVEDVPVVTPPVEDPPVTDDTPTPSGATSEIALIVFVALLAVGIVVALFLPGNTKRDAFSADI